MEIADKILKHPKYIKYLKSNEKAEKKRKFCRHDIQHAVDVARVAYIIALENGWEIGKDVIYAAALLHDIAKWKQYGKGKDHALEGAVLAADILEDIGVDGREKELIMDAIRSHRDKGSKDSQLSTVLYAGDKACRLCTHCSVVDECDRFTEGRRPSLEY